MPNSSFYLGMAILSFILAVLQSGNVKATPKEQLIAGIIFLIVAAIAKVLKK